MVIVLHSKSLLLHAMVYNIQLQKWINMLTFSIILKNGNWKIIVDQQIFSKLCYAAFYKYTKYRILKESEKNMNPRSGSHTINDLGDKYNINSFLKFYVMGNYRLYRMAFIWHSPRKVDFIPICNMWPPSPPTSCWNQKSGNHFFKIFPLFKTSFVPVFLTKSVYMNSNSIPKVLLWLSALLSIY